MKIKPIEKYFIRSSALYQLTGRLALVSRLSKIAIESPGVRNGARKGIMN
jgi:hypothetical protein